MGLENHVFYHETGKSGLFPCYRLKINDFLSSYNQNLKIIFTPVQQIVCYCKSRLGTLQLISWWRVTYGHLGGSVLRCPPREGETQGSNPTFFSQATPVNYTLVLHWLLCQVAGTKGSVLGLACLASADCKWRRQKFWSATCVSVAVHTTV